MRILIAEDDLVSRNILTALLTHFGHDVVAAVDGQQALEAMQQPDSPRLAIMDWVMPRMDGVDVCRHIRKITNANPPYIILLTGKDDEKSIVEGLDAGANDYLTKPYRNEELRARVGVGQRMLELQADLIRAKDALAHEAMHDALTGAQNRRAILQALAFEMSRAKRQNSSLSIGMCDIDHFKKVNDQYGHLVGDDVLKGFVKIMRHTMRDFELLGRYGGEEFLVISPQSSGMPHQPLYERLRKAIAETDIQTSAGGVPITVSIGVALATGAEEMDTLLASADAALYRAKREGRNRVAYAGPDDAMEKTE
jgi:two-component system, cell cycle response regulator